MVVDGATFLRRAQRFFSALRANQFPNASTLADECRCSVNTAQRVIYRLRDEYLVPIEYDSSERGYYLTDKNYDLPHLLPPGKDELTALLLARELVSSLEASDLKTQLDNLWHQFTASNSMIARDLAPLASVFSSDSTAVADLADHGILTYVTAAHTGEWVKIRYKSPWRHKQEKEYEGRIERVHFSDGSLYLRFTESSGREVILNASFVRDLTIIPHPSSISKAPLSDNEKGRTAHWLEGFGVWAGKKPEQVTITIGPPASEYFAAQRWHAEQVDTWEGDRLIRSFPAIVSPEVVRRVLSVGNFVLWVDPPELRDHVLREAQLLLTNLGTNS